MEERPVRPIEQLAGILIVHCETRAAIAIANDWVVKTGAAILCTAETVMFTKVGEGPLPYVEWKDADSCGVCVGELYRLEKLYSKLVSNGVCIANDPAAILRSAFSFWGSEFFEHLDGIFSLAIWDRRNRALVMYGDSSGARLIYWHQQHGRLVAASRLDLVLGFPAVVKSVGTSGLSEYLRFLDISPPNSIYEGINALEPGVILSFPHGEYGAIKTTQGPAWSRSFEAAVDELDEVLRDSISLRWDDAGKTGFFLSGGVDSALLCAIAAQLDPNRVEAFTLGFKDPAFDEGELASRIAAHLGIRHHRLDYDLAEYAAAFHRFFADIDLPFADPAGLPTLLLFKYCKRFVDVVLDGTGADTLLGVMPARHARWGTQYVAKLPGSVRLPLARLLERVPGLCRYKGLLEFDCPEDLLIRWQGWQRHEIEALMASPVTLEHTRFFTLYRRFKSNQHMERYSALLGSLPDDRVHQAALLTSLTVRFPYWDSRVVRLIEAMPVIYRYTAAEPKRLFKALLERYLPRAVWDQPKHGFDFPFEDLLRFNDHELMRRYLHPKLVKQFDVVRPSLVDEYVAAFVDGDRRLAFRIWALVVLFAWLDNHYKYL